MPFERGWAVKLKIVDPLVVGTSIRIQCGGSGSLRTLAAGAALAALAVAAFWFATREQVVQDVLVPELSAAAQAGKQAFDRHCAQCHGENARGSAKGPPLVHRIYHPRHHADVAFDLGVQRGVRAHHWRFGDMPPQPAVTPPERSQITRYVRELQRANGIF